jgi:hypothetical protein
MDKQIAKIMKLAAAKAKQMFVSVKVLVKWQGMIQEFEVKVPNAEAKARNVNVTVNSSDFIYQNIAFAEVSTGIALIDKALKGKVMIKRIPANVLRMPITVVLYLDKIVVRTVILDLDEIHQEWNIMDQLAKEDRDTV